VASPSVDEPLNEMSGPEGSIARLLMTDMTDSK
jgi:hypothetical protein